MSSEGEVCQIKLLQQQQTNDVQIIFILCIQILQSFNNRNFKARRFFLINQVVFKQ